MKYICWLNMESTKCLSYIEEAQCLKVNLVYAEYWVVLLDRIDNWSLSPYDDGYLLYLQCKSYWLASESRCGRRGCSRQTQLLMATHQYFAPHSLKRASLAVLNPLQFSKTPLLNRKVKMWNPSDGFQTVNVKPFWRVPDRKCLVSGLKKWTLLFAVVQVEKGQMDHDDFCG